VKTQFNIPEGKQKKQNSFRKEQKRKKKTQKGRANMAFDNNAEEE